MGIKGEMSGTVPSMIGGGGGGGGGGGRYVLGQMWGGGMC